MDTQNTITRTRSRFRKWRREPDRYPLQLTQRDLDILALIYDHRFLPSDHITALIPGSERKILERLQKLFHHEYVDRLPDQRIRTHAGSEKMVYAITHRAADLLASELGIEVTKVNWASKNKSVTERHVKHTGMISKFRTVLTLACTPQNGVSLSTWREHGGSGQILDPELADNVKIEIQEGRYAGVVERRRIVPDAFIMLEDADYQYPLFLEADRSTMTSERFLKKLNAYWVWWKSGGCKKKLGVENFRVLTVTQSEQRRDNLKRIAIDASPGKGGSGMYCFACQKDYSVADPASILAPIWLTAKDDHAHHLLE